MLRGQTLAVVFLPAVAAAFLVGRPLLAAEMTPQEERGKKIYLTCEGDPKLPITALLGDSTVEIPGAALPCVNCHGRDGRGRPEGGVLPSDVTWASLTKPYGHDHPDGRRHGPFDDASLRRAIGLGTDPAGNRLGPAMPRYAMSQEDMAALLAYLRHLGQEAEPGVTDDTITVGALLPTQGPLAGAGAAMESVVRAYFEEVNEQGGIYHRRLELRVIDPAGLDEPSRALENPLSGDEVFALTAGFVPGQEERVASLAEKEALPLVGLLTLFPQRRSPVNRYVFYLYGGLEEQAQALVQYFAQKELLARPRFVVVRPDRPEFAALARKAEEEARQLDWRVQPTVVYPPGGFRAADAVAALAEAGSEVVLFMGPGGDEDVFLQAASRANWTPYVLLFGPLMGRSVLESPRAFQGKLFLSYPTLPGDHSPAGLEEFRQLVMKHKTRLQHLPLQVSAYCAAKLLVEGLKRSGRELDRDTLIASLESFYEFSTGLTRAITYTPNRRIGMPGAYVVRVDLEKKQFVPESEWIGVN